MSQIARRIIRRTGPPEIEVREFSRKPSVSTGFPIRDQELQDWASRIKWVFVDEVVGERLRVAAQLLNSSIVIDREIRGGIPVVKGTRITVSQIIVELVDNRTLSAIADDFDIDISTLTSVFEGLAIHLDRPFLR